VRPILQFALVTLLLAANAGCAHRSPQPGDSRGFYGNSIVIKGSDTMVLLAQWWAENYMKSHPHLVIQVNGGGSGTGIDALINGTTDICQSSRPVKEQERAAFRTKYQRDVVEIKVALDAIGVYVNEANPARELSLSQARDIYTGRITDWREVGGAPGRIILYSRENNKSGIVHVRQPGRRDLAVTAARFGGLLFELVHQFPFGDFDFGEMACADFRDKLAVRNFLTFG
jgi:phosphate transport system substrate-binding protein